MNLNFSFVSKPMEYARLAEKNGTVSPNAPKGKLDGNLYRKIYGKVSSSRKDCYEKPCSNKCMPGCCTEVNSVPAEWKELRRTFQEIHSTLLTNAVKWETVLFYGLFTGSLLYGDFPFHTGTIVYGDFSSLRALCGGSSLGSLRPVFSVGTSFVYALYGGFSLWRLCLTGPSVECRARWFLIFPYLGKRKSLQREESP